VTALAQFKQQLGEELNAHAVSLSAPTGRPARPRLRTVRRQLAFTVGFAAAAAAAAVFALPLGSGTHSTGQAAPVSRGTASTGGPSAAPNPQQQHAPGFSGLDVVNADYAVQSKPGGMVTVRLFSLKGLSGLQATLDQAGIPAAVMAASPSCHATAPTDSGPPTGDALYSRLLKVLPTNWADSSKGIHDIYPGAMDPGDHLLFIAPSKNAPLTSLMVELVRQVPSCIAPDLVPTP